MVKGIGTDIIEIERIQKALERTEAFYEKVYTSSEKERLSKKNNKAESAAGLFAVKEAVSKALGTGFRTFSPCDIEVYYSEKGKPEVRLLGEAKVLAETLEVKSIFVSISHCKSYAVGMVVLEG